MSATSLAALRRAVPRAYWMLLAGTFLNRLGGFVVPLLFVYLTQQRGLSVVVAGRVAAAHGLGSLLGTLAGGVLADRLGRRATMLGALVLGATTMLAFGAARTPVALGVGALLLGLTADAFRPASSAAVADLVPREHRLAAFTLQYWLVNLGFACAAVLGGAMAGRGFGALFVADAATTLAFASLVYFHVPESRPATSGSAASSGSVVTPFADRRVAPLLALSFATAMVFLQHLTGLPEDMRRKGVGVGAYGFAIASNGVGIVILQPLVSRVVQRYSAASMLALGALATGVGFGLTAFARDLAGYVGCVLVWTVGEAILAPVQSTVVATLSPASLRGRYQAAFGLSWSLAALLSPALLPPLMTAIGLRAFWGACAALAGLVALAHLVVTRRALAGT